jgi:hypothetical protein
VSETSTQLGPTLLPLLRPNLAWWYRTSLGMSRFSNMHCRQEFTLVYFCVSLIFFYSTLCTYVCITPLQRLADQLVQNIDNSCIYFFYMRIIKAWYNDAIFHAIILCEKKSYFSHWSYLLKEEMLNLRNKIKCQTSECHTRFHSHTKSKDKAISAVN